MHLLSPIYFPVFPPNAAPCRQFNDLAKAAGVRGKRVEVSQMLRFPIAELVGGALLLPHQRRERAFSLTLFLSIVVSADVLQGHIRNSTSSPPPSSRTITTSKPDMNIFHARRSALCTLIALLLLLLLLLDVSRRDACCVGPPHPKPNSARHAPLSRPRFVPMKRLPEELRMSLGGKARGCVYAK
jgi:hypothetical protein